MSETTQESLCRDCGRPLDREYAKLFTVCDHCFDKPGRTFSKRDWPRAVPEPSAPADDARPCEHCWHQWGIASGGIGSDGSSHASGTNRCCHCGEYQHYDYRIPAGTRPRQHGRFFAEISMFPA